MRRLLMTCAVLLLASAAFAQKTPAPFALQQYFDNSGDPLSSGGMCVFLAGTSTLATSYTTAAGTVANANPLLFNSAGRPTTSGFFLTPSIAYKLVLKDFTGVVTPTCIPDTGVSVWTQDHIEAIPGASGTVVTDGTAGESIAAGDAVYLSDGSGSRTQGTWYRTDSDFSYASFNAPLIGVAEAAINSGEIGAITLSGVVEVATTLSPGVRYWATTTPGALTATVPTNARAIGVGYTTTSIAVQPGMDQVPSLGPSGVVNAVQIANLAPGRCSLTTGLAVTISDVTAATTVYYALMPGASPVIGLYTGSVWQATTIAQLSIAVPNTASTMYDLFVDYNDGTPALAVTAWTNDTTRATALTTQDNIYVKTGDTQQRYVCSFRTTAVSGQTEDSFAKRFVWNAFNQVPRELRAPLETANTWNYSTNTWRQANGNTANKFEFVIGLPTVSLSSWVQAAAFNSGVGISIAVAVGVDSITAPTANQLGIGSQTVNGVGLQLSSSIRVYPAIGYHYAAWLEWGDNGGGTATWYGDNGGTSPWQTGISGTILG